MNKIAEFLKTKVKFIIRDRGYYIEKAFEIRTDTLDSKNLLFLYLIKKNILYLVISI
jgi:hypothetical protein